MTPEAVELIMEGQLRVCVLCRGSGRMPWSIFDTCRDCLGFGWECLVAIDGGEYWDNLSRRELKRLGLTRLGGQ